MAAKRNEKVVSDRDAAIARGKASRAAARNPTKIPAPPTAGRAEALKAAIPGTALLEKARRLLAK